MPRFWRVFVGPRVTVRPQVMSGPASCGQHVCTGRRARSTSLPSQTISWHGPEERSFGAMLSTCFKTGNLSQRSARPFGGSGSLRYATSLPTSLRAEGVSTPIPAATRCTVPKRFPRTGMPYPLGRSNSSAGPPARSTRSQISVISSRGETSAATRLSSPLDSSCERNSRRSAYFIAVAAVRRSSLEQHQPLDDGFGEIEQSGIAAAHGVDALAARERERKRGAAQPAERDERRAAEARRGGKQRQGLRHALEKTKEPVQRSRDPGGSSGDLPGRAAGNRRERSRNHQHQQRDDHQRRAPADPSQVALERDAHRGKRGERQGFESEVAAVDDAVRVKSNARAAHRPAVEIEARDRGAGVAHRQGMLKG